MNISYKVDAEKVLEGFRRTPRVMSRNLDKGLDRAALQMVRTAQDKVRDNDSIAFSLLVQSIRYQRTGPLERTVWPAANYARYLEEGTKPGYMPNGYALAAWLKARGAANPKRRSFALAKHIFKHGTKPHPFWQPSFEAAEPEMRRIIAQAVERGVSEVFGS
ncbi:hypothetical protein LVJ85_08300 [Neisseria sp. Dent CA1/247]|uniref:HK97-gp10 family putative phage morphogenesis protein n=1 Tax=Neisseria sp. Dent CA1/247 TaxID=2912675 RepID=UPI001FD3D6F8|nr:HK97-gp10 family putative phage morphogenesis protein [Neisseria sp. Dent CA1/247]UOO76048.1 hypothetical protein LVJ85_08300 [Neisseria sp. Dent CA1/247]